MHATEDVGGGGGIASVVTNLGVRWRWVVSFTLLPLYIRGKRPWEPVRLGGPKTGLYALE
jgi:hypothetical protein